MLAARRPWHEIFKIMNKTSHLHKVHAGGSLEAAL